MAGGPSIFHEQLLSFLYEDFQKRKKEEGWDDQIDHEVRDYVDHLSLSIRSDAPISLEKIIENYQNLLSHRGSMRLEQKILEAFNDHELNKLNLNPLRIYRGLPRRYRKDQMSVSQIKNGFQHLPSLLKLAATKSIFSLYSTVGNIEHAKIALFCQVIADGLGDYYALLEVARLIKKAHPHFEIQIFFVATHDLPFDKDFPINGWEGTDEELRYLRSCDLILQIPTYYEKINEIKEQVEAISDDSPLPKWESIGEYGFLESSWYHPDSNAYCLGLHFLEMGILTRSNDCKPSIFDLKNDELFEWLFDRVLNKTSVTEYRKIHRFFLAYLFSFPGTYVYLHALCKSLENDPKDIDICLPDGQKLISYFDQCKKNGIEPLAKHYGVSRIVIYIGSHVTEMILNDEGKTLRLLCPASLDTHDFQSLIAFSEDFVAGRGDQSFSEIVSHRKGFFYDPRDHSCFFIKDLIALAENRIKEFPTTLKIVRLFSKVLEYNLPIAEDEWVDEMMIQRQEPMELITIGEEIGEALKDPKTFVGFKKLSNIMLHEHSCNDFILQMVKRAICHRRHREIAQLEEEAVKRFTYGETSFVSVVEELRHKIYRS